MRQLSVDQTLLNATKTFPMRWLSLVFFGNTPMLLMRSEIATNLNVFKFVKIVGEICKTLGVRWSNRYGVTAPYSESS